jgi:hypothetical protein
MAAIDAYRQAYNDFMAAKGLAEYLDDVLTDGEKAVAKAEGNLKSALQEIELLERMLAKYC